MAAIHADMRLMEREPRRTAQGEPKMNKTVVTALAAASRPYLHESKKASQPVIGSTCPPAMLVTTGRNQAAP